jgi:adenylyltransferase/sulfurtransferase
MVLSEDQQRRYARHTILSEIGVAGQERLAQAKILVIGAGGLGSPALLYLAAAGVGKLGIADHDVVELSNLQRQVLFETADIGRPKTESAMDALSDLNPEIVLLSISEKVTEANIAEIITDFDVVLDGSDNFETRFAVHDACYAAKKPLVSASISQFRGQISVFKAYEGSAHPCYRCLYADIPPPDVLNCEESGILGSVAGVMGAMQAGEAIKEIMGIGESLSGFLLQYNALKAECRKTVLPKDPACTFCRS